MITDLDALVDLVLNTVRVALFAARYIRARRAA